MRKDNNLKRDRDSRFSETGVGSLVR